MPPIGVVLWGWHVGQGLRRKLAPMFAKQKNYMEYGCCHANRRDSRLPAGRSSIAQTQGSRLSLLACTLNMITTIQILSFSSAG